MSDTPKYSNVRVRLTGQDGNAYAIVGAVRNALRKANVEVSELNAFMNEAMEGDYNHLLQTCMKWVNVS